MVHLFFEVLESFLTFFAKIELLVIIAPPIPVVIILFPLKLNIPRSPKDPAYLPFIELPSDSAESSINFK